jgi:dGTPase
VADVWQETGLRAGQRHPFAYVMEACDDIAYSVLDAEDAVKKGLASFADLMSFLEEEIPADDISRCVIEDALADHRVHVEYPLSPSELNDVSMQKFRVHAIALMIDRARRAFEDNLDALLDGTLDRDLLDLSEAHLLCKALKRFDREHAYRHKFVLALESRGFNVIQELMDHLWYAIENRDDRVSEGAVRATPFAAYAYQRISENYRRVFENAKGSLCDRYRELQLLTDMISGMTDTYAVNLCDDLNKYHCS